MADEARAMLDALMGGDRNAPLPQGSDGRAPRRTKRSCFDRDICPLYCAWGVDVYELFRNTKSDTLVGINPNVVDPAAHEEFKNLPPVEQERLGYKAMLFRKLQELVQKCDRTVNRNKEKLRQENAKQAQSRGGQDFVQHVDEAAVTQLASAMVRFEYLEEDVMELVGKLQEIQKTQDELEEKFVNLLKKKQASEKDEETKQDAKDYGEAKAEQVTESEDASKPPEEAAATEEKNETKQEDKSTNGENKEDADKTKDGTDDDKLEMELQEALEKTRIEKQHLLVDLKLKIGQYQPLKESIQSQRYQLEYVKSDITSDKTVCEVSGNFMSSRDADERIAAHYAGKQYVGWKLVRDKLEEMQKEYGRYGPPGGGRPPPPRDDYRNRGRYHRSRSRERARDRGRGPSPPRWERGGGGGGYRGGGGYGGGGGGGDWRRDRGGGGRRDSGRRHWR